MDKEPNGMLTATYASTPSSLSTIVHLPDTLEEAWETKRNLGEKASFIAGGTLMQLQREQGQVFPAQLVSLEKIKGLKGIEKIAINDRYLKIGALTTLSECQVNPVLAEGWPVVSEAIKQVASPAVRNRATIAGNISYRIGDTIPALLALDAEVSWYDGAYLHTDLLAEYLKADRHKDNALLLSVLLPERPLRKNVLEYYRKVGRRESFIPSLVTVSIYACKNKEEKIEYIRLAVGGGVHEPERLYECENFLTGRSLTEDVITEIYEKITDEFAPESDPFVSEGYRKSVAANLIASELDSFQNA